MGTCFFFQKYWKFMENLSEKNLYISEILYCKETYKEREKIFANISRYFSAVKKTREKNTQCFIYWFQVPWQFLGTRILSLFSNSYVSWKLKVKKKRRKNSAWYFFSFQRHFGSMENTLQVNLGENFENPQYRVDIFQLFTFYHLDSRTTFNSTFNVKVSMCWGEKGLYKMSGSL